MEEEGKHKRGKKTEEEGRTRKAGEERKGAKSRKRREEKRKKKKEVYSTSPSGGNQVDGLPPVQHGIKSRQQFNFSIFKKITKEKIIKSKILDKTRTAK